MSRRRRRALAVARGAGRWPGRRGLLAPACTTRRPCTRAVADARRRRGASPRRRAAVAVAVGHRHRDHELPAVLRARPTHAGPRPDARRAATMAHDPASAAASSPASRPTRCCSAPATRSPGRSRASTSTCSTRSRRRIFGDPNKIELRVITAAQRMPAPAGRRGRHRRAQHDDQLRPLEADRLLREYYRSGQKVLVRKGEATQSGGPIGGIEDLAGKKVCAPDGSTSMTKLRTFTGRRRPVGADTHTGCLVLFQQGEVDAITGDDTVLAGLAAQDPYAEVVQAPAFTAEPYGLGVNQEQRRLRAVRQRRPRADARRRPLDQELRHAGSPTPSARRRPPRSRSTDGRRDLRDDAAPRHRPRPGGWASPSSPEDALRYLAALGTWRDERKAELDVLDEAALGAPRRRGVHRRPAALDGAVEGRRGPARPARGHLGLRPGRDDRAGATLHPRLGPARRRTTARPRRRPVRAAGAHVPAQALAVSLPEACRLSDALAASLRARLGIDPSEADLQARLRALRASVERVRDLVDREPAQARAAASSTLDRLDTRVADVLARAQRGADVGGLVGPARARCRPHRT